MRQTVKQPFSYNYTNSFYTRQYGTWAMVAGSVSLVLDNLLHWLQLRLETMLHKHCCTPAIGDVRDIDVQSFPQGLRSWKIKVVPYTNYIRATPTQKKIKARAIHWADMRIREKEPWRQYFLLQYQIKCYLVPVAHKGLSQLLYNG